MDDECDFLDVPCVPGKKMFVTDYLDIECGMKVSCRMSPNKMFMFLINSPRGNAKYKN